ncbi:hypothetical protein CU633_21705 [Bacillus sp. V3-13]|uniref:SWIM zinc finger family protein n=1 Tax=Bacillus sp. V3-13 TaxID=2053728 RepID=UPI000C78C8AC|nr:hypothetical protein [Bacillus sp. V3-13]PLR75330.1 hypothetical protein CU633_21705 [Bacillus sp. V3-13]
MKLSNFEAFIEEVILDRGLDYFQNERVVNVKETADGYTVEVDGTDDYTVEILLGHEDEIVNSFCDCPYDWGPHCKHIAAALFAIREKAATPEKSKKKNSARKEDLQTVLQKLKKDELIGIILDLSKQYSDIQTTLLYKYSSDVDEISAAKKLIRDYINHAKRRAFVEWRDVGHAVQGAELTLENARTKAANGDTEAAVLLCIATLSIIVDMLQYCDDSSGIVGGAIEESIFLIDEAALISEEHLNADGQKRMFTAILKEALHSRYNGWEDWRFSLLKACTYFCSNPELHKILDKHLEKMQADVHDNSWSGRYAKENIKLLQLELIERVDGKEEAEKFINQNLHFSDFRKKAISNAFSNRDYSKVIQLCLDGEQIDKDYRGLVNEWKRNRYRAYEQLKDVENQRKLAYELLFEQDYSYFLKLKELYQPEEWSKVLEKMVKDFETSCQSSVYEQILIEEKLTSKLLEYCQRRPSYITDLYPHLTGEFSEEVDQLFKEYIEQSAAEASNRKKYYNVCRTIKTYKKACGKIKADGLIEALKQKYERRPAFLDELEKIK